MIVANEKFIVNEEPLNSYKFKLTLTIMRLQQEDFGTYRCISKNSIGQAEEVVELYELPSEKLEEELQVYVEDYEEEPQTEPTTTSAHAPRSGKSPKNNWYPRQQSPTFAPSSRTRSPSGLFSGDNRQGS